MSTWTPTRVDVRPRARRATAAVGLAFVAILAAHVAVLPVFVLDLETVASLVVSILLGQAGYIVVGAVFLLASKRGLDYLDVEMPTQWRLVAGVTVGILAVRFAFVVPSWFVFRGFVPSAPVGLENIYERGYIVLIMIPLSWLVIAPVEELLFRSIQKYMREVFTANSAIVGAALLYTGAHWLTLGDPASLEAVYAMTAFVIVAMAYGWLYERTGTVVAPIIAHATYNSVIAVSTIVLYHPLFY